MHISFKRLLLVGIFCLAHAEVGEKLEALRKK